MPDTDIRSVLSALCDSRRFAVLATDSAGQPYASLVAYAATPDLQTLFFATARATRKYVNITANPKVALLIDSRSNTAEDLQDAVAATATGVCREVPKEERAAALDLYAAKHPDLDSFVRLETTALLQVDVAAYCVVDRFQHVVKWHVRG